MSLRDQIKNAVDIETESIDIPQWDVTLTVRSMDGRTRARFLRDFANPDGNVDFEKLYPDLAILCVVEPDNHEPLFNEDDRSWLLTKSGAALETVALAAMRVSGLDAQAQDRAGKSSNSSTLNGDSTTS